MSTWLRRERGSSLVETTVGLIVLIPIVLFLIDVGAVVIAQTENDKLAKACARAAAEQPTVPAGGQATSANVVMANQAVSTLLQPQGNPVTTNPSPGLVRCMTTIKCTLPVPVPLGGPASITFNAVDTEPVVGELPQ
jgi:Flp pilus assembly protein TadG